MCVQQLQVIMITVAILLLMMFFPVHRSAQKTGFDQYLNRLSRKFGLHNIGLPISWNDVELK